MDGAGLRRFLPGTLSCLSRISPIDSSVSAVPLNPPWQHQLIGPTSYRLQTFGWFSAAMARASWPKRSVKSRLATFDSDGAAQPGVPGAIDFPHTAGAEHVFDAIPPELRPGRQQRRSLRRMIGQQQLDFAPEIAVTRARCRQKIPALARIAFESSLV